MAEPTYKNIAVASTFSPRFRQVLAEAKRVRDRLGSQLSLVYAGEKSAETTEKFSEALAALKLPADSVIYYQPGNPADAILKAIADNDVDLIVAGALEKEVVLHQFLGNVARRLVREATSSVMLFTRPEAEPKPLKKIVFIADYSDHARAALRTTYSLAAAEGCECLYVIRIVTTFDLKRASLQEGYEGAKTDQDEEAELEKFVIAAGNTEVPIDARCIRGNTGFAAADFVQSIKADLLVVPLPAATDEKQTLPGNVSWITDVIPCNLWVIR